MLILKNFSKHKDLIHGFMEIKDGLLNAGSLLRVLKVYAGQNLQKKDLVLAKQVHASQLYYCPPTKEMRQSYRLPQADALASKNKKQILVIKTADCIPLLFYDQANKIIGAIHAGRAGLRKKIILKTIQKTNLNPKQTFFAIGPHIRKCCYHLRGKSLGYIKDQKWQKYINKKEEKFYLNLTQIALDQLAEAGVSRAKIEDTKICTHCEHTRFFSARYFEQNPEFYGYKKRPCFWSWTGLV